MRKGSVENLALKGPIESKDNRLETACKPSSEIVKILRDKMRKECLDNLAHKGPIEGKRGSWKQRISHLTSLSKFFFWGGETMRKEGAKNLARKWRTVGK